MKASFDATGEVLIVTGGARGIGAAAARAYADAGGHAYVFDVAPSEEPAALAAAEQTALDVAEGADIVMVKPALGYLDVVRAVHEAVDIPVAAYNVSGEHSMVEAAAERGWIDRERAITEILTSIRRAGADMILTYWAHEWAATYR